MVEEHGRAIRLVMVFSDQNIGRGNYTLSAYVNSELVGHVDYSINNEAILVDYIFVKPEHRRKKYASLMLDELLQTNGCSHLQWYDLTEMGRNFLKSFGQICN